MTTTTDQPTDPLELLTIAELDAGSRLLHADLVHAITAPGSQHRWAALAIVAYLLDRRTDPSTDVGRFRRMTATELSRQLGLGRVTDQHVDPEPAPDQLAPPDEAPADGPAPADEVAADPTAPAPE